MNDRDKAVEVFCNSWRSDVERQEEYKHLFLRDLGAIFDAGHASRDGEVESLRKVLRETKTNMLAWQTYVPKTSSLRDLYQKDLDKIDAALSGKGNEDASDGGGK